jgi:hypothetical protein
VRVVSVRGVANDGQAQGDGQPQERVGTTPRQSILARTAVDVFLAPGVGDQVARGKLLGRHGGDLAPRLPRYPTGLDLRQPAELLVNSAIWAKCDNRVVAQRSASVGAAGSLPPADSAVRQVWRRHSGPRPVDVVV